MVKLKQRITNPMTVIAIFATLSETSAAISLPFLDDENKEIYIWFLISFPFYLLFLFFATLNFNYRSLYAPSDFEKGKHFIKVMDNAERSGNAQDPPDEIGLQPSLSVQYPIRLPESLKDLHIIDARWMNKKNQFRALLEQLRQPMGNPAHVVVFLVVGESETLLKESALKFCRNAKKRSSATFCIAYNLSSHDVTVIDQYCRADTQQAVAL
ncbi:MULTISPECIES: hypothetical protein [unclassified Pseudomonas]|uniref:hypothetical protein n=1 Tax=unclassified Pseudomonas TaxID=196821 RepID=UPI0002707E8E|nr:MULTISPECIES: hypothetical protein [unclassified Pseudomonas]EJM79467.1 hypothetical protein PMI32_04240 [Pseudomonas sp. GM60]